MHASPHADRQLLEMKLQNFRRNRDGCPQAHRSAFDQLIAQTENELRSLTRGGEEHRSSEPRVLERSPAGSDLYQSYPFDRSAPWQRPVRD